MYQPLFISDEGDNLTRVPNYNENEVVLGQKYYLTGYPDFYFVVRKAKDSWICEEERICLYRTGVVNPHLYGDTELHNHWICNDPRDSRKLQTLTSAMLYKVEEIKTADNRKKRYL